MEIMKTPIIILVLCIFFSVGVVITNSPNRTKKKADKILIDSLIKEIRYHRWKDSIYWIHISKCSFISNDQIEITKDRYIKLEPASKPIN